MISKIRPMSKDDKSSVIEMMRTFYSSAAVLSNGSEEIFINDVENCINDNPYLEGYIVEGDDGIQGYAMVAKSFSTEFGKPCIWVEDLYLKEEYRGLGIGAMVLDYIAQKYRGYLMRLEVEEDEIDKRNLRQFAVRKVSDGLFEVDGELIFEIMKRVNLDDMASNAYFQKRIKNDGIIDALVDIGLKEGDMIRIGDYELQYFE